MNPTTTNGRLDAALRYATLGYSVFPCRPDGKTPLTEHGCQDATTDPEIIHSWWWQHPNANVGLSTNGLLAVDDDTGGKWPSDPEQALSMAEAPMQRTPRGGRHWMFRGDNRFRNTTSKIVPNVDTRANGGYIVVAPSIVNGKPYEWLQPLDVQPEFLPEPPQWIVDALADRKAEPHEGNGQPGGTIPKGQRNATFARLAGSMRRQGADVGTIVEALRARNRQCQPPLPDDEVKRIAESIGRYEPADKGRPSEGRTFNCYSMAQLDALDLKIDYIFRHALVRDTPGVIGGREKSLKSLIGLDCGISMATFTPWFGHFEPVRAARSVYFAGEGGLTVLREYARRVAAFKGFALRDVVGFHVCDEVPSLDSDRDVDAAVQVLQDHEAEFCFFDPLYLMLAGNSQSSDVYAMGAILRRMLRACRTAGVTPIVLHHFRKSKPVGEAPDLADLSQSGLAEFAGQWLLVNRARPYDEEAPGQHDLITRIGSRVGFSSKWAVHVEEGTVDGPDGRYWQPELTPPSEARERAAEKREAATLAKDERELDDARRAVVAVMVKLRRPVDKGDVADRVTIRRTRFNRAWASLIDDGSIVEAGTVRKANNRAYPTYKTVDE